MGVMSKSPALILSFLLVSTLLVSACQILPQPQATPTPETTTEQQQAPSTQQTATSKTISYETSYLSPAAEEAVGFVIVVNSEGIITDAQTTVLAQAPTSVMRQESFAKEFPKVLKGKKLSELTNIDRVGGSSLTTAAFNKSIKEIQSQAQS